MQGRPRTILLACALAIGIAGCGSGDDGTIPSEKGELLVQRLDAIEDALTNHDCNSVSAQAEDFKQDVNDLPAEVDDEVKRGLQEGADRLVALSQQPDQCEDVTGPTGEEGAETSTTTDTDSEESVTTSTAATSTTTSTEAEEDEGQEEEESPPPDEDVEQGGPPTEVPGNGNPGGGRTGGSESGGLTGDKGGRR